MKNVIKLTLLAVAVAISMNSCSRYALVNSRILNNSDLSKYKTFSLQKLDTDKLPKDVRIEDAQVLYYEITKKLESIGYKKAEEGGDMTVYLSVSMKKSIETSTNSVGYGVGGAVGSPNYGGRYNAMGPVPYTHGVYTSSSSSTSEVVVDGFLMMDLVETSSNKHIFCSEISTRLGSRIQLINDNEEMSKAMDKLFKKFPYAPDSKK